MQSQEELYNILKSNKEALEQNKLDQVKTVVVSIAPQSVASIAAKYNLTPLQVRIKLKKKIVFKSNNFNFSFFFL